MPLSIAERRLSEPVTGMELVEHILQELAQALFAQLEPEGKGALLVEASFFRVDGDVRHVHVETGQCCATTGFSCALRAKGSTP